MTKEFHKIIMKNQGPFLIGKLINHKEVFVKDCLKKIKKSYYFINLEIYEVTDNRTLRKTLVPRSVMPRFK